MHERSADACDDRAQHDEGLAECCKAAGRHEEALHHQAKGMRMRKDAAWHRDQAGMLKSDAADDLVKTATSGSTDEFRKIVQAMVESEMQTLLSKTITPDRVSAISRSDVPSGGFGITANLRAVPRAGQPDVNFDKANVPTMFKHLVENLDEI
jgi:hypothetical protein